MILIEGLSKQFGATRVLDALSLDAPSGQRIALVGSNGAGKTSLFRCLLGEYTYNGSITLDGLDPRRDRARLLRMIGFVPQIAPRLETPVGAFIRYVAEVSGAVVDEIEGVATSLGLDVAAARNRAFVRLSGGMKQKLLIALALGRPTRLLILDEPTANLDPAARAVFYDLLAARGRHTAMIISSHRIDEIAPLVDRVVELDRGRIVLDDTVSDVGALGSTFLVEVETSGGEESFAPGAREWGLTQCDGRRWRGVIAGPDRLRFLGFVARHAGHLSGVELREAERESEHAATLSV
jgi:ABC-2 type transport system ATP-binding protein